MKAIARLLIALALLLPARLALAVEGPETIDLPPMAEPAHGLAVVYSGDGGWRDLDKAIGEWLQAQGWHVVGVDTLLTFWHERPPEVMARDLEGIVATADPTGDLPILIIAYSFGADVYPFAHSKLSPSLADRIRLVTLLAPGFYTGFHVSVAGWAGYDGGNHDTLPVLTKLPADRLLCIYGTEDVDGKACTALKDATVVAIKGGHHFDEDYPGLGKRILAAFEER